MFSLLDGFSGYNWVLVVEPDRLKTTCHTKWGKFAYRRMPFGLMNAGATFQRTIDIVFRGLIRQSVVVYLDDVNVFSRKWSDHICHLKKIFEWCRKYRISLKPKKNIFAVSEGNLLGHTIARSGIKVDPKWVRMITQIPHPNNKKVMQSFLGKINILQKFISDYAQIVKLMQDMIKKDAIYN